jgi:hypothetical protein
MLVLHGLMLVAILIKVMHGVDAVALLAEPP